MQGLVATMSCLRDLDRSTCCSAAFTFFEFGSVSRIRIAEAISALLMTLLVFFIFFLDDLTLPVEAGATVVSVLTPSLFLSLLAVAPSSPPTL